jgi:hypothetical protein
MNVILHNIKSISIILILIIILIKKLYLLVMVKIKINIIKNYRKVRLNKIQCFWRRILRIIINWKIVWVGLGKIQGGRIIL